MECAVVFGPLGLAVIFGFGRSCMCRYMVDIDGMCCGLRTAWLSCDLRIRHSCLYVSIDPPTVVIHACTHDVEYCANLIHFFSIHMHNIGACCRSQGSIVWSHKELLKLFFGVEQVLPPRGPPWGSSQEC